ncbi:hypothetical protein SAMN06893096_103149 [Geodermatophilus pulveris]|uniref:Penicillin binding protein transpeptidase domain-containing protein n=1 Tax=Geodermatophilus pulveris TaxID=1564159 RepID=A0A239DG07_9ACTN|nr:hypothetical protein [Geodermatophilus pulveris]SNS30758.1 hypothetical protein SAMN06893096_103149 [Geodermatophilus pulveris]
MYFGNGAHGIQSAARRWFSVDAAEPGPDLTRTGAAAHVPGHQIAGKTGTSQGGFSVAFAGFTPAYSASVMVFDPKRNREVPGGGGDRGATIWHDAMAPVLTAGPVVPFPPADPVLSGQVPARDRVDGP